MKKLFRHPAIIIIAISLITIFFGIQLFNVKLDNDITRFIPDDNPEKIKFGEVEEQFGDQMTMVIGLKSRDRSVLSPENINAVRELSDKLKEIQWVNEVLSITSADVIVGSGDGMSVEPLLPEGFTGKPNEIDEFKSRLMSWDLYRQSLISGDFSATQIALTMKSEIIHQSGDFYDLIKQTVAGVDLNGMETFIAGQPVINATLTNNMKMDLAFLIPFVIVVIVFILIVSYRRPGGVILPLLTVIVSVIWTIGLMSLLHVSLSIVSTVIPVLMVAVGSAYGIHIITHYYDDIAKMKNHPGREEHDELIFETLRKVGPAVILAGLTTIAGFGALSFSQLQPMRSFGVFSAVGVLNALIVSLLLTPAILIIRHKPLKTAAAGSSKAEKVSSGGTAYVKFISRKKTILLVTALLFALGIAGAFQVVTDNNMIKYFKDNTEIARADKFLNEEFSGTQTFSVVVDGKEKGAILDPEVLAAISDLGDYLKSNYEEIGQTISIADMVKRMNKVMHWEDPAPAAYSPKVIQAEEVTPVIKDNGEGPVLSEGFGGGFEGGFDSGIEGGFDSGGDWEFSDFSSFAAEAPIDVQAAPEQQTADENDILAIFNKAYEHTDNIDIKASELLRLANKLTNYHGEAYNEIPADPAKYGLSGKEDLKNLIAQYLLLYSGNTSSMIDDALEPSKARMTVQLNSTSSVFSDKVAEDIREFAKKRFPADFEVSSVGIAVISSEITHMVANTQNLSIIISLSIVFIILIVYFRSIAAGLIGTISLAFAILVNFAVMGFAGIKLDIATAMIASIAIGIGIDYTIHFMSNYRREYSEHRDEKKALAATIGTTGKAVLTNAISVGAGFAALLFSQFNPIAYLGALIALTMGTSSLAAVTILPALLNTFKPAFLTRQSVSKKEKGKTE